MNRVTKDNYKSIVYISHPYAAKLENVEETAQIMRLCNKIYPDYLFISPVNMWSSIYEETDYQKGLDMCLCLLDEMADEMWVFGDYQNSKGCVKEIEYCSKYAIPYKIISDEYLRKMREMVNAG